MFNNIATSLMALMLGAGFAVAQDDIASPLRVMKFSPDGKLFVLGSGTSGKPGDLAAFDTTTWREIWRIHDDSGFSSAAFSPDGSQLVVGRYAPELQIIDSMTSIVQRTIRGHDSAVRTVDFANNGTLIATGGFDKTIRLWDAQKLDQKALLKSDCESISYIEFSPDSRMLGFAEYNPHVVRFYDIAKSEIVFSTAPFGSLVPKVTFSRDGKFALIPSWGGDSVVMETDSFLIIKQFDLLQMNSLTSGAFSPDGKYIGLGRFEKGVCVQVFTQNIGLEAEVEIDRLIRLLEDNSYTARVRATEELAKIGPLAEKQLKAATNSGLIETKWRAHRLLNRLGTPEGAINLTGSKSRIECLTFSPDGKLLVSGDRAGNVLMWDVDDWKMVHQISLWPIEIK